MTFGGCTHSKPKTFKKQLSRNLHDKIYLKLLHIYVMHGSISGVTNSIIGGGGGGIFIYSCSVLLISFEINCYQGL